MSHYKRKCRTNGQYKLHKMWQGFLSQTINWIKHLRHLAFISWWHAGKIETPNITFVPPQIRLLKQPDWIKKNVKGLLASLLKSCCCCCCNTLFYEFFHHMQHFILNFVNLYWVHDIIKKNWIIATSLWWIIETDLESKLCISDSTGIKW